MTCLNRIRQLNERRKLNASALASPPRFENKESVPNTDSYQCWTFELPNHITLNVVMRLEACYNNARPKSGNRVLLIGTRILFGAGTKLCNHVISVALLVVMLPTFTT